MLLRMRKNWVTHAYITSKDIKWDSLSEKQFGNFLTLLNIQLLVVWTNSYALGQLSQRKEYFCWHHNLYVNVYSSFIYNSQKLEAIERYFRGLRVKQTIVHSLYGVLVGTKGKKPPTHVTSGMDLCSILLSRQASPKRLYTIGFHLYDILEMKKITEMKRLSVARV